MSNSLQEASSSPNFFRTFFVYSCNPSGGYPMNMPESGLALRPTILGLLDAFLRDLKYTFRTLVRTPGFTAVAVLTLGLGIGANTAIFTLLDQILLRLLPVKNPQQLVLLTMKGHYYGNNWGGNAISHPMFRDFREHNRSSPTCSAVSRRQLASRSGNAR